MSLGKIKVAPPPHPALVHFESHTLVPYLVLWLPGKVIAVYQVPSVETGAHTVVPFGKSVPDRLLSLSSPPVDFLVGILVLFYFSLLSIFFFSFIFFIAPGPSLVQMHADLPDVLPMSIHTLSLHVILDRRVLLYATTYYTFHRPLPRDLFVDNSLEARGCVT